MSRSAVLDIFATSGSPVLERVGLLEAPAHFPPDLPVRLPEAAVSFAAAGLRTPRVVSGTPLTLTVRTDGVDAGSRLLVNIRDWDRTLVRQIDRTVGTLPDGTSGFVAAGVQLPPGWFDTEVGLPDHGDTHVHLIPGEIAVLPPVDAPEPDDDAEAWVLGHHLQYWRSAGPHEPRDYSLAPDATETLAAARSLGLQSTRFHPPMTTKWWHVEPVRGEWKFSDELIEAPLDADISVLGTLDGTPRFASSAPPAKLAATKGWPLNWAVYPAKNLADWRTYVRTTVTRYRDSVRAWEIWNEPDSRMFLGLPDGTDTPERVYTSLVSAAAEEIRAIDPAIIIVAGSVTAGGQEFLVRAIQDEGLLDHCDVISFHGYGRVRASDRGADAFANLVGAIHQAAGPGREVVIWDTEAAIGTLPEGRAGLRIAETELKGILARRAAGINRLYFYNGFRRDDPLHGDFRVLWGYDDRRPLAIQPLLAASQWLLAGSEFETALVDEPEGAHVYVFRHADGRRIAAGWTSAPSGSTQYQQTGPFVSGRIFTQTGADTGRYEGGVLPLTTSVRYFDQTP